MAARLKVFITSDGLTDYVVATGSRAKALAAWGVRQDLFKEGSARETDDPALRAAALAQPETVLRKPSGGRAKLAQLKPRPKPARPAPSKAALRKVSDLERRLAAAELEHDKAMARLASARRKLDAATAQQTEAYETRRREIERALKSARRALD